MEIAITVDAMEPFVKATYNLGDGDHYCSKHMKKFLRLQLQLMQWNHL